MKEKGISERGAWCKAGTKCRAGKRKCGYWRLGRKRSRGEEVAGETERVLMGAMRCEGILCGELREE